ncbi:unnamed protein product [Clonostachys rosea]|uniref:Uncharacterized protein n=1 Tax=Bionectria ochroleuca TaxID=29856 RepID=A0ABY6UPP1_BIOOC|nr:unnamed protein product [Clonostachys rosea]
MVAITQSALSNLVIAIMMQSAVAVPVPLDTYQRDLDEVSDFGARGFDERSGLLTRSLLVEHHWTRKALDIRLPAPSGVWKLAEVFKRSGMRLLFKKKGKRALDGAHDVDVRKFGEPYDLDARDGELLKARDHGLELSNLVAREILDNRATELSLSGRALEDRRDFDEAYGSEARDIGNNDG